MASQAGSGGGNIGREATLPGWKVFKFVSQHRPLEAGEREGSRGVPDTVSVPSGETSVRHTKQHYMGNFLQNLSEPLAPL